jgi:hypothetical protein
MIGHSAVEHPWSVLARLIPFPDQGKDMLLLELHFLCEVAPPPHPAQGSPRLLCAAATELRLLEQYRGQLRLEQNQRNGDQFDLNQARLKN